MHSNFFSIEQRRCFESHLADMLLKISSTFPAVSNLSKKIAFFLEKHKTELIEKHPAVFVDLCQELYNDRFFGRIASEKPADLTFSQLIDLLITTLKSSVKNVPLIMHIQQLFMMHIYDKIIPADSQEAIIKKKSVEKVFPSFLFNISAPARKRVQSCITAQPANITGAMSTTIGFASPQSCSGLSPTEMHCTALGDFNLNPKSAWAERVAKFYLFFIAGPSGHTGSLLLLREIIGEFSGPEQKKQYTAAIMALLMGGGFHTYDEIMAVVNTVEENSYSIGKYSECDLPESIRYTKEYAELKEKFPGVLEPCEAKEFSWSASAYQGAVMGTLRGISNVFGETVGTTVPKAQFISHSAFYASYFAWSLNEACKKYPEKNGLNLFFEAGKQTLGVACGYLIASFATPLLKQVGNRLRRMKSTTAVLTGRFIDKTAEWVSYSGYAFQAMFIAFSTPAVVGDIIWDTALQVISSCGAQRLTESMGRWMRDRLGVFSQTSLDISNKNTERMKIL